VVNSGGIRKNLDAGPVTRLDIVEMLPFANAVSTFECSGAELRLLLETTAAAASIHERGVLHLSGVRFTYTVDADKATVVEATVAGKPIDDAAVYRGVGNDFVVFGNPERYLGFEPRKRERLDLVDADVVLQAVETAVGAITAPLDGRFRQVEPVTADR
jgi:2',3'-cyclic-nucleotide 2'-phosphodiesterase (5'-nucleotidase family)